MTGGESRDPPPAECARAYFARFVSVPTSTSSLERRALGEGGSAEHSLALALSRSVARCGADKHAPEGTDPDHDGEPGWKRKARVSGFDLEATTEVRGDDRERRANLCRFLIRPPLADRRLGLLPADQVALQRKSPWSTSWFSMSADTFLERLGSLVPRPRTKQVLYRHVLRLLGSLRSLCGRCPRDGARGPLRGHISPSRACFSRSKRSCSEPSRIIFAPQRGQRTSTHGSPRECSTRASHFGQKQWPPSPISWLRVWVMVDSSVQVAGAESGQSRSRRGTYGAGHTCSAQ